jgi:hypothetical protein
MNRKSSRQKEEHEGRPSSHGTEKDHVAGLWPVSRDDDGEMGWTGPRFLTEKLSFPGCPRSHTLMFELVLFGPILHTQSRDLRADKGGVAFVPRRLWFFQWLLPQLIYCKQKGRNQHMDRDCGLTKDKARAQSACPRQGLNVPLTSSRSLTPGCLTGGSFSHIGSYHPAEVL